MLATQACGGGTGEAASAFGTASASAGSSTTGTTAEVPEGSTAETPTGGATTGGSSSTGATSTGDASTTEGASTGATGETADPLDCVDGVAWSRVIDIEAYTNAIDDLTIDADGNSFVVGFFAGQADFGGGPLLAEGMYDDAFITKYGPLGEHVWSRQYGDENTQRLSGVAIDPSGNILVTGRFAGSVDFGGGPLQSVAYEDIMLAKLGPDGEHLWSKSFGGGKVEYGRRVVADAAGNVLLTAQADGGQVDFGSGPLGQGVTAHVVKFGPDGALLWHRAYGGDATAGDVTVDPDDNVIAVGEFRDPIDFGAGVVAPNDDFSVFIVKLDPGGAFTWFKQSGGLHDYDIPRVSGVKTDGAGNIHLAGSFAGTFELGGPSLGGVPGNAYDVWVAALSPDGEHLWSSGHGAGAEQFQTASDVSANAAGQTAVTGPFDGAISLGGLPYAAVGVSSDAFVGRFAGDGSHELSRAFQADGMHSGDVVAIDEQGSIWLVGTFEQPFEAGGEQLVSNGYDSFLIRLCP